MKQIKVILSPEAEEVYKYLNKQSKKSKIERSIINSLSKKVDLIKVNCHYGDPVPKKLIPKEYIEKYGIKNLFRVELPNYWRMLYSLVDGENQIEIIAFVLDISDHDAYNKKFGYK
ncbi:hypothetical protein KO465_05960 [Candidatus Micrarchaeota archaeon]|jgi:hypothetical protein|nr:hypothetical protein [Candidatus Micrarchaeota archaeon]